ncbi:MULTISPECIES: DUF4388 domain-containing protein [unclassified Coleofasciculus]|uniref:DUF4388 domain-containing protein n=1 Tax=unclassified Coleofasciculus TaxID=2692782 RepID=UPI00187F10C6|nr:MULTISPECIES: DUF4388 domain-containing protein [unclassified Coleofasciculus]MBE9125920.1 DUF4388 domain-containing protein [Coleofasciculus sp. LEGE 07081]MBE9149291.1 DUF4388 domain-containing protein [Coleofasciculus sp. LEGE 07092]
MSITSCLTDFSVPEILQFIEKGRKTGLLTLGSLPDDPTTPSDIHYIWVHQGRIVAAANQLDHQGLATLMSQQMGVSKRVVAKLVQLCPTDKPLGLSLRRKAILSAEQLKQLFQMQVLERVSTLFELKDGQFKFIQNAPIPTREMTGLTVSATEAILIGLRMLKKWDTLADKLPDPNGGLVGIAASSPPYQLNYLEKKVWDNAQGTLSLSAISKELKLTVEEVQQIAFRLITLNLVEEVPLLTGILPTQEIEPLPVQLTEELEHETITPSLLQNLVNFLHSKGNDHIPIRWGYASERHTQEGVMPIEPSIDIVRC